MSSLTRRSPRCLALALAALGLVPVGGEAWARKRKRDKQAAEAIDHIALAARLVRDGHFDRAESVLQQVDQTQEGIDLARLHTLIGLVKLKKEEWKPARDAFRAALAAKSQEKVVHLFLAQAYFGLEQYKEALAALAQAGPALTDQPDVFLMRARAHWKLGQQQATFDALDQGIRRLPETGKLLRAKVFYLVDLGLHAEAATAGQAYLARPEVGPDDYVAIGEALRQARQLDQARAILEQAKIRFPGNPRLLIQLAQVYLVEERFLPAAMLFEEAARHDERYRAEAAELYRRAGRLELALALNAGVADQKDKVKQRLSILLRMEQFESIPALEPRLSRLGLLEKEEIKYALAYSYYRTGAFDHAERHLKDLRDAGLFEKATQLRKAMASCRKEGWECF
jgi:tetratricopeptide (TPR) repeat protein